jgi:predicted GNAT family acetyltransferase
MSSQRHDDALDEAIEESFPASDPPANTVATGARLSYEVQPVHDNCDASQFEVRQDGQIAVLIYERRPEVFVIVDTRVPPGLRGVYVGTALVKAAIASANSEGRRLEVVCPFARSYLQKHL